MAHEPPSIDRPLPGWVVARRDGTILVADPALCTALGASGPEALLNRPWPSLVAARDAERVAEARAAEARGAPWSGALVLITAHGDEPFAVELFPAGPHAADLSVLRIAAVTPLPSIPVSPAAAAAAALPDDVRILLTAIESGEEAVDPASAARAVLQAIRTGLAFDWGVVLRFVDSPRAERADGAGVEVVATYPAGMAGVERGVRWSPLDDAERILLESGEPALDGALTRRFHERSPLARLPAFGMRSRLQIPVFAHGRVRGCVSLYATTDAAFGAVDGLRLERFVRPLRAHIEAPLPASETPATASPPPGEAAPSAALPGDAPPTATPTVSSPPPPGTSPSTPHPGEPRPAPQPGSARQTPEEPMERGRWEPGPRDRSELVARRLGALGEMVSGVAHELNNPLTAILGYAQILPSLEGRDREQALATIEQEALRASRIVRNLLAFARQHRTSTQATDVEAVLRRVVDVRRQSLAEDHVTVELRFGGVPRVLADEYQLEQVFLNLVNNADQAMQPQGGTLTLATEAVGSSVRIVVADTGRGVPEEVADRIFEPFFTTRDVGAGAGLGLAIVYGIVAEHDGHVWVERSPSGGAQFVVELPRIAEDRDWPPAEVTGPGTAEPGEDAAVGAPAEPRPADTPAPEPPASRERILVVDDELPIRALTNEILGAAGYVVDTAASGEEALRQLERESYDAIVADMRLPAMEGDAFFRIVTDQWPGLATRVLFITGDPEADRDAELLEERGAQHLEKPFDTQTLLRAVRTLLATPPRD